MLGPRFIPESIFYTQSVMLSLRFIPWSVVRGPWSVVRGPWSVVRGPWAVVCGPWSVVRSPQSSFYNDRILPPCLTRGKREICAIREAAVF